MATINDFFRFETQVVPISAHSTDGFFVDSKSIAIAAPEAVADKWQKGFAGAPCETIKEVWDNNGFFAFSLWANICRSGTVINKMALGDIETEFPPNGPYGTLNSTGRATQTYILTPTVDEFYTRYTKDYGDDGLVLIRDEFPDVLVLDSPLSYSQNATAKGQQDSVFNPTIMNPATVTLPVFTYDKAMEVIDSDGLFNFLFPQCAITPPTPTTIKTGFNYPIPGEENPNQNQAIPPFQTRMPYQNYSYSVPGVTLFRKK